MFAVAVVLLVGALIAAGFGLTGIAGAVAWLLFVVGVIILVVHLVTGRRARVP